MTQSTKLQTKTETNRCLIYRFIASYYREHGCSPTVREIAGGTHFASETIRGHVRELVEMGCLEDGAPYKGAARCYLPLRHPNELHFPKSTRIGEGKAIVLDCKRDGTTHVRLTYSPHAIYLEYGALIQHLFKSEYFETLYFDEFPELKSIHDGLGWIWEEVWSLIEEAESANTGTPITVCLMEVDRHWLNVQLALETGKAI